MSYHFDFSILGTYGPYMAEGVLYTLLVAIPSMVLSTILGLLLAAMHLTGYRVLRAIEVAFVDVFRTVPVICLLFWIFYVLPIITGIRLDPVVTAITALSLNGAAFSCEAFRGGMEAIPSAQTHAAYSLGLSKLGTLRYVIVPQALFSALPALSNVYVTIIKLVPVAVLIAVPEVMFRAEQLTVQFFRPLELYTGAAIIYTALVLVFSIGMRQLEKLQKWEPV